MKVDLIIKPEWRLPPHLTERVQTFPWKRSLPFLVNPRAYLVHRVRAAHSHVWDGKWRHDTADYWCANCGRGEFVATPPEGMLLCAICEANAVAHGQPSAEELAGRHVCIGRLRAVRMCCTNDGN